jgi:PEP-CTERM motif
MFCRVVMTAAVVAVAWGGTAFAAPVTCPPVPLASERIFSVSASAGAACLAYGPGNDKNTDWWTQIPTAAWMEVDASDSTSGLYDGWLTLTPPTSGLAGTFSVPAAAWGSYGRIAFALKSGEGRADPDYAVFELFNNGSDPTTGSWTITGFTAAGSILGQSLSHGTLYGLGEPEIPAAHAPEPASLVLMGSGLIALAARARRRKQ